MLPLPERQMGEAWEPSKKQRSFENREALDRKVLPLSLQRVNVVNFRFWIKCSLFSLQGPVKLWISLEQNRTLRTDSAVEDTKHTVLH